MATPVSFQSVVEQYAGCLNRDYAGKEQEVPQIVLGGIHVVAGDVLADRLCDRMQPVTTANSSVSSVLSEDSNREQIRATILS